MLPSISREQEDDIILHNYSYIDLIVKGPGNVKIFYIKESNGNCLNMIPPDELQINNDTPIQNPNMTHILNDGENKVKIIWKDKKLNT